ncbi:hypothetical protein ACE1SV_62580 [Streptomyces sennicomposti]
MLVRYDDEDRFQYVGHTTALTQTASAAVTGLLVSERRVGRNAMLSGELRAAITGHTGSPGE